MNPETRLTENKVIQLLILYLESEGWQIREYCLGNKHGRDIMAVKDGVTLIVEAKGARASKQSSNSKREYFDSGQIKTHFGKAIVQILEYKSINPQFQYAIAHPDDAKIRKNLAALIPFLSHLGIMHYWVSDNGQIQKI